MNAKPSLSADPRQRPASGYLEEFWTVVADGQTAYAGRCGVAESAQAIRAALPHIPRRAPDHEFGHFHEIALLPETAPKDTIRGFMRAPDGTPADSDAECAPV